MKEWTYMKIAKLVGVSEPTVSRVVNGSPGVSREKRERVLQVLKKLNYHKENRKLHKQALNIGLMLKNDAQIDGSAIFRKLVTLRQELPQNSNLLFLDSGITPRKLISKYLKHELDGLLILGFSPFDAENARVLNRIPHVWLNSHNGDEEYDGDALGGNELGGRIAARYLLSKSCGKIALFNAESVNPGFKSRIDGFCFELYSKKREWKEFHLYLPEKQTVEFATDATIENALTKTCTPEFFHQFDGIFMPEGKLTPLLYRLYAKLRLKKRIPHVVSCNHTSEYLTGLYPRPASVDLGPELVAVLGLKRLLRIIRGSDEMAPGISVIVSPRLLPGEDE